MLQDLRSALRLLRLRPAMSMLVIGMLAIGVAATAVVFTLMDAILWHPIPFSASDRIVRIRSVVKPGEVNPAASLLSRNIVSDQGVFTGVYPYGLTGATVSAAGESQAVTIGEWSSGLLTALNVHPTWGRDFTEQEFESAAPVVIVSADTWKQLQNRRDAGAELFVMLDGVRHVVVGAMPPGFEFPVGRVALWRPLPLTPAPIRITAIGFLRPGVSLETAKAFVGTLERRAANANIKTQPALTITPFVSVVESTASALRMLLAAVVMLLLIAAANAANVLVTDGIRRHTEMAIRISIGASRRHLLRQTMVETLFLCTLAAFLALVLADWILKIVAIQVPYLMAFQTLHKIDLDWRGLAFAVTVAVATGTIVALFTVLRAFRINAPDALRGQSSTGPVQARWRTLLMTSQLAITLCLLTTAGLLSNSFLRLATTSPGFDVAGLTILLLDFPAWRYKTAIERRTALEALRTETAKLPGVLDVTIANSTPPRLSSRSTTGLETGALKVDAGSEMTAYARVEGRFFSVLGISLIGGRFFDERDTTGGEPVVIVSRSLASRLCPNDPPLAQRFRESPAEPWRTVVGVVADVRNGSFERPVGEFAYYTPLGQDSKETTSGLVIRSREASERTIPALRNAVAQTLPDAPILDLVTGEEATSLVTDRVRFLTSLVLAFASVALSLAIVGVYGTSWYSVRQRTREIAVRVALGASSSDIHRLVLASGVRVIGYGLVTGVPLAIVVARALQGMLFGVSTADPLTLIVVSVVLATAAVFASYLPARSAASIDPIQTLRMQ